MGKLPSIKKITREDLKDAPDWINQLISPLNSFMESVYQTLNKQVTFSENVACQIREVEFKTSSTYSTGTFEAIEFVSNLKTKAKGLLLMQIYEKSDNFNAIKQAVSMDWLDVNGTITIYHVSGLSDSKNYVLRVLVI